MAALWKAKTLDYGGEDAMCSVTAANAIHTAIPGSKLVVVENSGHFPWIEQPEVFWKHVHEFLSS